MALEKQRRLVELLLDRTKAGKVDWKPTPDPEMFQVSSPNSTIQLRTIYRSDASEPDYLVIVLNSEGEVVDTFNDVELFKDQVDLPESMRISYFNILKDMHERARRNAKGADRVLDSILKELGDDDLPF
jgi:hypothetical protein